eukprot:TRINITY_DN3375_c0_g1_i1.p1 TRINITY_DN3375_c0_g1~~TRINITY_DN3375_c0_g1_i1.p1  ORF type:complete len:126 (+),score=3.31 TRINITY_DN3375_c0_g1_i1:91-468(+)
MTARVRQRSLGVEHCKHGRCTHMPCGQLYNSQVPIKHSLFGHCTLSRELSAVERPWTGTHTLHHTTARPVHTASIGSQRPGRVENAGDGARLPGYHTSLALRITLRVDVCFSPQTKAGQQHKGST